MRRRLTLLAAVAALLTAGCGTTMTTEGEKPATTEKPAKTASLGQPVRDGKFQFVVRKVTCGKDRIGSADFGKKAQGQYCLVSIQVANIGKEAQTLDGSSQYLYAEGGQKLSADTEAAIYLDDAQTVWNEINPGNKVEGILIFDVPQDAKPARLELHDSAFSGGIIVDL